MRVADTRVRDIAALAGITERSTQRIVADLKTAGYRATSGSAAATTTG